MTGNPSAPARHVNHVGLCVADLDRARRFYVEALGFVRVHELAIPDDFTSSLLRVPRPVGLTACYVQKNQFVLELLHFDRPADPDRSRDARERRMTDTGLTHLSFGVDDLDATCTRVVELGGEVLEDTRIPGMAVMVRDPDGQLLELLPTSYRPAQPPPT